MIADVDSVLLWVIHVGSSVLAGMLILWLILWSANMVGSAILFRIWTTELTLRTAYHLWNKTLVPPPSGWKRRWYEGDE